MNLLNNLFNNTVPLYKRKNRSKNRDVIIGTLSILFGILAFPGAFIAAMYGALGAAALSESAVLAGGILGGLLTYAGIYSGTHALNRTSKFKQFAKIIGRQQRFRIEALANAARLQRKETTILLNQMIRYGYFEWAEINRETKELVLSPNAPLLKGGAPAEDEGLIYKHRFSLPAAPIVFPALIALLMIFAWGVTLWLSLLMGAGLFAMMFYASPIREYYVEALVTQPKQPLLRTGIAQTDELLKEMNGYCNEIIRVSRNLGENDPRQLRSNMAEIARVISEISKQLAQNPDKVKFLHDFIGYYLPTSVKLFVTYDELRQKPDKGENIRAAMKKIEDASGQILIVARREFDDLFSDKAMDISADVAVMQSMIQGDGYLSL
jgi:5-bromo-4-chloroindolyl phosphate hydrolysis protein